MDNTSAKNLKDFLSLLRKKKNGEGKIIVFAGAAISMAAPSYLPIANWLLDATLDVLIDKEVELLLEGTSLFNKNMIKDEIINLVSERFIPPEMIYDTIYEFAGKKVFSALESLKQNTPNHNHYILAGLLSEGYIDYIVTTNFDRCIEYALPKSLFGRANSNRVWKIHGDITNHRSMVTTFRRVGKNFFDIKGLHRLQTLLEGSYVFFLGYGGTDADLVPSFRKAGINTLYWNEKDKNRKQNLLGQMTNICWITSDLNQSDNCLTLIAKELSIKYSFEQTDIQEINRRVKANMRQWEFGLNPMKLSSEEKILALLQILYNIASFSQDKSAKIRNWLRVFNLADVYAQNSQKKLKQLSDRTIRDLYAFRAEAALQMGHISQAGIHLKEVITTNILDHILVQNLLNCSALSVKEGYDKRLQSDFIAAEKKLEIAEIFLRRALKLCNGLFLLSYEHTYQLKARVYANLGFIHVFRGDDKTAYSYYRKAENLFRKGDLYGLYCCCAMLLELCLRLNKNEEVNRYRQILTDIQIGLPSAGRDCSIKNENSNF